MHLMHLSSCLKPLFMHYSRYLVNNWGRLVKNRKDSVFLIITGVHGGVTGDIGEPIDDGWMEDSEGQLTILQEKFHKEMEENNISICLEDLGEYKETQLEEDKIINDIKKHNQTIIFLAFCYTQESELNDILRSAGIYTALILQEDSATLTEGRYVTLDSVQRSVVEQVSKKASRNLILYGSSGTGKTLLLCQVLEMRIGQYRREKKKITVIVT